ncbi:hypothetical protein EON66_08210 [archaeon]|nr:MAG: hypothetical protein EON66_08210 [archaeon]
MVGGLQSVLSHRLPAVFNMIADVLQTALEACDGQDAVIAADLLASLASQPAVRLHVAHMIHRASLRTQLPGVHAALATAAAGCATNEIARLLARGRPSLLTATPELYARYHEATGLPVHSQDVLDEHKLHAAVTSLDATLLTRLRFTSQLEVESHSAYLAPGVREDGEAALGEGNVCTPVQRWLCGLFRLARLYADADAPHPWPMRAAVARAPGARYACAPPLDRCSPSICLESVHRLSGLIRVWQATKATIKPYSLARDALLAAYWLHETKCEGLSTSLRELVVRAGSVFPPSHRAHQHACAGLGAAWPSDQHGMDWRLSRRVPTPLQLLLASSQSDKELSANMAHMHAATGLPLTGEDACAFVLRPAAARWYSPCGTSIPCCAVHASQHTHLPSMRDDARQTRAARRPSVVHDHQGTTWLMLRLMNVAKKAEAPVERAAMLQSLFLFLMHASGVQQREVQVHAALMLYDILAHDVDVLPSVCTALALPAFATIAKVGERPSIAIREYDDGTASQRMLVLLDNMRIMAASACGRGHDSHVVQQHKHAL